MMFLLSTYCWQSPYFACLLILCFSPLECKVSEGRDFVCLSTAVSPVPGMVSGTWDALSKYLLSEYMYVMGTWSFLTWKQVFTSRKCSWNISLICSLYFVSSFQSWLWMLGLQNKNLSMVNPVSYFFNSLRMLMIDGWCFSLCVQLLSSPSSFFSVCFSFCILHTFLKCWLNSCSLFKNRALNAYRKLWAHKWRFLTVIFKLIWQGRFLSEPLMSLQVSPLGLLICPSLLPGGVCTCCRLRFGDKACCLSI